MKVNCVKHPGAILQAVSDRDVERLNKFKTGEQYQIDIKLVRNPAFHRKVFSFIDFCFEFWKGDNVFQCEDKQLTVFRNHLTVLAGFYESHSNIHGELRVEAKSLSYSSMTQEEFEQFYTALINAAIKHVFKGCDEITENQLIGFFA